MLSQPVEQLAEVLPEIIGNGRMPIVEVDCIQQFPIDIELQLARGCIPNTHRTALLIAFQMIKGLFWQRMLAPNPIDRLQSSIRSRFMTACIKPAHKSFSFLGQAKSE